jgi:hypothetical protein
MSIMRFVPGAYATFTPGVDECQHRKDECLCEEFERVIGTPAEIEYVVHPDGSVSRNENIGTITERDETNPHLLRIRYVSREEAVRHAIAAGFRKKRRKRKKAEPLPSLYYNVIEISGLIHRSPDTASRQLTIYQEQYPQHVNISGDAQGTRDKRRYRSLLLRKEHCDHFIHWYETRNSRGRRRR